jgi:streptogramin lyase
MRVKPRTVALGISLGLLWIIVVTAGTLTLEEAELTSYGQVYEINRGADGSLYLSDSGAEEIWQINASGTYTVFDAKYTVVDAKPDGQGDIWWTDGTTAFGRVEVSTNEVTSWQVPEGRNLGGLAFDGQGKIWMTEWIGYGSKLYSFDATATELCTYTLPFGSYSQYVLYDAGRLWLGHAGLGRIYRVDPSAGQAVWWPISSESNPRDLALDDQGNLWWADQGLHALARLEPNTSRVTTYTLPLGTTPQMIEMEGGRVWYTESVSETFGLLDPVIASGTTTTPTLQVSSVTSTCATLDAGAVTAVTAGLGSLEWLSGSASSVAPVEGWQIYEFSSQALPYGIASGNGHMWIGDRYNQKLLRFSPSVPGVVLEKHTNGQDADNPPGPSVPVGDAVTWSYRVENTGNVDLTAVTVVDDNGTPANPADDYTCVIGELAAGAVDDTSCSQEGTAVAGQYSNTATVSADAGAVPVADTDLSHYVGTDQGVSLEKSTNGEDADSPPGPSVPVGDPVAWSYRVENTGNVDLTDVTVVDDNGTPANPADDYTCVIGNLAAGVVDDTTCLQEGTAVAGQYANTATVSADAGAEPVSDSDPSHYLGQEEEGTYVFLPLVLKRVKP